MTEGDIRNVLRRWAAREDHPLSHQPRGGWPPLSPKLERRLDQMQHGIQWTPADIADGCTGDTYCTGLTIGLDFRWRVGMRTLPSSSACWQVHLGRAKSERWQRFWLWVFHSRKGGVRFWPLATCAAWYEKKPAATC